MDFTWTMNENEWKRLKDVQKSKKYDSNDCFGSCYVGGICCDFQHTSVNCNCNARKTCRGSIFSMYDLVLELFTQKRHSL